MDQAFRTRKWPWYIFGPAGTGKTLAMLALYERWPARVVGPLWLRASDFLPDFVKARVDHREKGILNSLRDSNLICLDDVGIREQTPAQADAMLSFLDTRSGKALIVTGNLPPQRLLDTMDDRVVSRMCSGVLIEVTGPDRRLQETKVFKA